MRVEVSQHEKRLRKLLKEFAKESIETGVLGGWYREQTGRVFPGLIVAATACRPVFRPISEKRNPFLMRRTASPHPLFVRGGDCPSVSLHCRATSADCDRFSSSSKLLLKPRMFRWTTVSITTDYFLLGRPPFGCPAKPLIFLGCFTPSVTWTSGVRGGEVVKNSEDLGVSPRGWGAGFSMGERVLHRGGGGPRRTGGGGTLPQVECFPTGLLSFRLFGPALD
ncbi:hypothetical protein PoB_002538600 [Plakobranchus ocellatus]|uniref:Uncharacterized protein n=1 Tax=Plakobranchus ocellatus TaxID=259542 RepID=A0AAV3ZSB2_9GAST|nr:hypothetical protein PoB_002538600 [Plakobranchus ocellatus]